MFGMRCLTAGLAALSICILVTPAALAAGGGGMKRPAGLQGPTGKRGGGAVPRPIQKYDEATLRVELANARKDTKEAEAELAKFTEEKRKEYEATPEVAPLIKAVEEDTKALEALVVPLRQKLLDTDSRYGLATRNLPEIQKKLDEAKEAKKASEVTYQQSEFDRYSEIIKKAEAESIGKNPACKAARSKLEADKAKLEAAMAKFPPTLEGNADYEALKTALANAKARESQLEQTVAVQ